MKTNYGDPCTVMHLTLQSLPLLRGVFKFTASEVLLAFAWDSPFLAPRLSENRLVKETNKPEPGLAGPLRISDELRAHTHWT